MKAGCLMHSFPLPGAPGAGEPSCSHVCNGQHHPIPTPGSPQIAQGYTGGGRRVSLVIAGPSSSTFFQCLWCISGATVQCQPRAPSATAGATQLWGVKPNSCPHLWPLSLSAVVSLAETRFPAGRRQAGSSRKAAGTVRMPGCGGWSSCGPSRCQSWAAGPR